MKVGRAEKLWSSPRRGLREPRGTQEGLHDSPVRWRPAEKGWQDPEGAAPGWAGRPAPEPGQGRGSASCQGQKNRVSVLLIRMVAPGQDVEEASTARLVGRLQSAPSHGEDFERGSPTCDTLGTMGGQLRG